MSVSHPETDPRNPISMEAGAWPVTSSVEDDAMRALADVSPATLVRQLVRASVEVVDVRDERLQACFDEMSRQAVAFAGEMLLLGIKPEHHFDEATHIASQRVGWLSYTNPSIETMPMYAIRHKNRYGGGELSLTYDADEALLFVTAKEDFLGHFAVVSLNHRMGHEYDSRDEVKPADIINPEHFTSAKSSESILKEFAEDLGASAVAARKGLSTYKRWNTCMSNRR
jgi:hypothetical protein